MMLQVHGCTLPISRIKSLTLIMMLTLATSGCGSSSSDDGNDSSSDSSSTDATETGSSASSDGIYRVSNSSTGSDDDSSWATAYDNLQDAIDAASNAGGGEIWVAAGTYRPLSNDDGDSASLTERKMSFKMAENVNIYGGFIGTETKRGERDWENNITILSGEIGDSNDASDNSLHVVTGSSDAILDGFTISDGLAGLRTEDYNDSSYVDCDATDAMDVAEENKDDELLRILNNYCYNAGGGMLNIQEAPTVQNVIFENNGASKGGAVYNMVLDSWPMATGPSNNAAAHFENVIFRNNFASGRGGAINNDLMTSPTFVDVQFIHNSTSDKGGALYNDAGCSPSLYNALFFKNEAERGAAIVGDGSSSPVLTYVTFYGNSADDIGGALYQGTYGAEQGQYNEMQLNYSLVLGNSSGSSSSSITAWNDSNLLTDDDSVIEYTDGELKDGNGSYDSFLTIADLGNDEYAVISSNSNLGWSEERDCTNWESEIDALTKEHSELYTTLPYDASCRNNSTSNDATNWYVYALANGSADGTSWTDAFTSLADAMDAADCYDKIYISGITDEETVYTPEAQNSLSARESAFVMKEGQQLLGGYCDGSSTIGCTVVLSGDLGSDSDWNSGNPENIDDDAYHVVVGADSAKLSNLTIEFGNADDEGYHQRGAGLLLYYVSPEVTNVTFRYNSAIEGAGIAAYKDAAPTLASLVFSDNAAERGGAILFRDGSEAELSNSNFSNNHSTDRGGAIYVDYGATMYFTDLTFSNNSTDGSGGALYIDDNASQYGSGTNIYLTNGEFYNNSAAMLGGAIAMYNSSTYLKLTGGEYLGNTANGIASSVYIGYSSTLSYGDSEPGFDVAPETDGGTIASQGQNNGNLPPPPLSP